MIADQKTGQFAQPLQYAGFGPRFVALMLDALMAALLPLLLWWVPASRYFLLCYLVPNFVFQAFYEVYLVKRWGGTPGKLIMGLRILTIQGNPVGYREAFWRAAPDLLFNLAGSVALYATSLHMTASHFREMSLLNRLDYLAQASSSWYRPLDILQNIWIWSELGVLLTNRKKRALHDFLAGTVVAMVRHSRPPAQSSTLASVNGV